MKFSSSRGLREVCIWLLLQEAKGGKETSRKMQKTYSLFQNIWVPWCRGAQDACQGEVGCIWWGRQQQYQGRLHCYVKQSWLCPARSKKTSKDFKDTAKWSDLTFRILTVVAAAWFLYFIRPLQRENEDTVRAVSFTVHHTTASTNAVPQITALYIEGRKGALD